MTTTPTFWGSRITVSADTTASAASIAALADARFAVAYQTTAEGLERNVEGRIVGVDGAASPDLFADTSSGTALDRYAPEAVQLENGVLAVGFVREFSSTDRDPALALRSPPGFAVGAANGTLLDASGLDDADLYEMARIDGGFAALYGRSFSTSAPEILLRRFDLDGAQVGGVIDVDASSDPQSNGDVAVLANGTLVVTWATFNSTTVTFTPWLRLFGANGDAMSGRFAFAGTPSPGAPQVAALATGGFVAIWQDGSEGRIYHQRFDDRGFTAGSRAFDTATASAAPQVVALRDGGYIIGWTDFAGEEGDGTPDAGIVLQRYGASGVRTGEALQINPPGDQVLHDMQELSDGRVALVYRRETGDATGVDRLVAQVIDPRENDIDGTSGDDVIFGREDDSEIRGLAGADQLTGLDGDDVIEGGGGADRIAGGRGGDELVGGSGDDRLEGAGGRDLLSGGSGDDVLDGGGGADELAGGGGTDVATYSGARARVVADLRGPSANRGDAAGDDYASIEGLTGSRFGDVLRGDAGANVLRGGQGRDQLVGRDGRDALHGGPGRDALTGGGGRDAFVFDQTPTRSSADRITDFRADVDAIHLDDDAFRGLAEGDLRGAAFRSNRDGEARDGNDRILYETDTGRLYFDRDGDRDDFDPVLFATLDNREDISAADFLVI